MGVIHLIRHAKPAVRGVLIGATDVPLAEGSLEPSRLAVDRVYSSPLIRAKQTAQRLFPGWDIAVVPGFAERGLGAWELHSWEQVKATWPDGARAAEANWLGYTPPGAEPWTAFADRVLVAWHAIPKAGSIAIVAHAGVNSVLHSLATGSDPVAFRQDYCEVISLDLIDGE